MTAAKFSSAKSEAESPLLRNHRYRKQIFDSINSIEIFRNCPSLNRWIISFFYFTVIMVLIFLLTPPVLVLISILSTIFMFAIVATRGTLLSMTSGLNPNFMLECYTKEDSLRDKFGRTNVVWSEKSQIMWIWCLIIVYTLPEMINSFVCFRKAKNKPSTGQFLSVIIPETFHTIGIALMIFQVLPKLDFNYFVLFLIWCVIEWGLHTPISTIYEIKNIKLKSLLIVADIVVLGIFFNFTIFNPFDRIDRNNYDCWIAILAMALIHGGLWQDVSNSTFSFTGNLSPFIKAREKLEPVKDSIFAWVSLWKIIIFIVSSFNIYASSHGNITELFTMVGPAFSDYIIYLVSSNYDSPIVLYYESARFPIFIVSFQIILSLLVNMKPNSLILRFFHGFDFRSRWGLNLPVFFGIAYVLWFEYIRGFYCSSLYNVDTFEHLTDVLTEVKPYREIIKIFSFNSSENWDALLLKISCCWILLHFLFRSRVNAVMKSEDLEKPEAKTPQEVEVYVILENEKVKEEKKLEC
ncbi:chitin synthase chs-2 isoform X1 [Microplitis demolitor]|uniref:chitin synthase chs-2 isoform X1 n=1 Tax=Microplitis demolitor TaxID=69319 RepID=UPI0004CDD78B|nr:chitin synthase chs-2 isoform X1 [Microplitis demolitor]